MRKTLLAALVFFSAMDALPASAIVLLGGSVGYSQQDTAGGHPWSATSVGFMQQSYFDISDFLGVYTAATLGFMVGSQDNGTALNIGQYQGLDLDILLGIGARVPLTPFLTAIGGAGIYMGSATLAAGNQTLSSYYAGGFGAGVGLSLLYALSMNWGIGCNLNAAYSFVNPGDAGLTMSPRGISLFGGIGVTWSPSPLNAGPRWSRFAAVTTTR
jgi:hypothetical protein